MAWKAAISAEQETRRRPRRPGRHPAPQWNGRHSRRSASAHHADALRRDAVARERPQAASRSISEPPNSRVPFPFPPFHALSFSNDNPYPLLLNGRSSARTTAARRPESSYMNMCGCDRCASRTASSKETNAERLPRSEQARGRLHPIRGPSPPAIARRPGRQRRRAARSARGRCRV